MSARCPLCDGAFNHVYGSKGVRGHLIEDHKRTADEAFEIIQQRMPEDAELGTLKEMAHWLREINGKSTTPTD